MTRWLVAEFARAEALVEAARQAASDGFRPLDALSPLPLDDLDNALGLPPSPVRWPMLGAALVVAAGAYALEYLTAVDLYPFNSGGRPPDSWPVFLLVPFEVGVLAAALAGFAALLILCRLPRIDHPLFRFPAADRAMRDRFVLVFEAPEAAAQARRLEDLLFRARALRVEAGS